MKSIVKIFAMTTLVAFSASCHDDFLERAPLNAISDASFWKTPKDLELYTNSFYNTNVFLEFETGWGTLGLFGKDADAGTDTQVRNTYNSFLNSEYVIPTEAGSGGWDWVPLRELNYFMDNYTKVDAPFDDVKQYVGETLFFRSKYMFDKVMRFGDIPWAETVIQVDSRELYSPRLPRNEIITKILADLDNAVAYLPARGTGAWTGRITKEAAIALAARIALYEGTWEKYHALDDTPFKVAGSDGTVFIQKAADMADALIALSNENGYPALDNVGVENGYRDMFNLDDFSASKETLLWRKHQINSAGFYPVIDRYSADGSRRGATKNLVDSYLMADGTRINPATFDDSSLVKVVEGRDPRLAQTICINDGTQPVWMSTPVQYFIAPKLDQAGEANCPTGYQTYKGHNYRHAGAYWPGESEKGILYMRFGETLLIYAEAKAELGTLTQADLNKSINKLRERVGMPNMVLADITATDPNFEFANLSPIIQEIRRERKVELALEGFRYADIMRWAAADELIVGKSPVGSKLAQWVGFRFADYPNATEADLGRQDAWDAQIATYIADENGYIKPWKNGLNGGTEGYKFDVDTDYLFPLPISELTLNPELEQNPGWN